MNYDITTTIKEDEWEQTMVCEFASETIAKLVLEDMPIKAYHGKLYIRKPNSQAGSARLTDEGKIITVYCKSGASWALYWDTDPDTNREKLVELAQTWQEQEEAWLPIRRYFNTRTKDVMNEWAKRHGQELNGLRYQVLELVSLFKKYQEFTEETLCDILNCLDTDFRQIEKLRNRPSFLDRIIRLVKGGDNNGLQ